MHIIGEIDDAIDDARGLRVTLRVLDDTGRARDLVGTLVDGSTIERRDGTVIAFDSTRVAHFRRIPERTSKAGTGAPLSVRVKELETAMASAHPGAPSIIDPRAPLRESLVNAVDVARMNGWRPEIRVRLHEAELLGGQLEAEGWASSGESRVLVHDSRSITTGESPWHVTLEHRPTDAWQAEGEFAGARIPSGDSPACYATAWSSDSPVGVGRLATGENWGVLGHVFVLAGHRGRGVGTALLAALAHEAATTGVDRLALPLQADNAAGLGLCSRLGFRHHHGYRHWVPSARSKTETPRG